MKRLSRLLASLVFLSLPAVGYPQEEKDLPSQKTKEALEKFKKATALPGKSVEALRESGKAKLQEILGTKAAQKAGAEKATDLMSLPTKKPESPESPKYSPVGKRDPFRPFTLPTKAAGPARDPRTLTPLERYEIAQLKLVAILWDIKEPRAMVEDSTGLGYIVKVGTPIGPNYGKIKVIKPNEVVVEETVTDFYGEKKSREVSIKLPE